MKYDKLVRDNIPEIIEDSGKKGIYRVLDGNEFKEYLEKKLDEEVAEFHESKSIEELADILEVLMALMKEYGFDDYTVHETRWGKKVKLGGFTKKICLLEVEG